MHKSGQRVSELRAGGSLGALGKAEADHHSAKLLRAERSA